MIEFGYSAELDDSELTPITSRLTGRVAPDPESRSYYGRLSAEPTDSSEIVHLCYVRTMRLLLKNSKQDKSLNPHEFRKNLRNTGIAYNVLFDPATRMDYDLRLLGLREPLTGTKMSVPEEAKPGSGKAKISMLELLVLSRTFGPDSLLSVLNAVRLLTEEEVWEYLQGNSAFNAHEMESLKAGLELLRHGVVSVVQFEQAFQSARSSGYSIEEILVHAGWTDNERISVIHHIAEEASEPAFRFVEVKVDKSNNTPPEGIRVSGQMPSWASQMDWGEAEPGGEELPHQPSVHSDSSFTNSNPSDYSSTYQSPGGFGEDQDTSRSSEHLNFDPQDGQASAYDGTLASGTEDAAHPYILDFGDEEEEVPTATPEHPSYIVDFDAPPEYETPAPPQPQYSLDFGAPDNETDEERWDPLYAQPNTPIQYVVDYDSPPEETAPAGMPDDPLAAISEDEFIVPAVEPPTAGIWEAAVASALAGEMGPALPNTQLETNAQLDQITEQDQTARPFQPVATGSWAAAVGDLLGNPDNTEPSEHQPAPLDTGDLLSAAASLQRHGMYGPTNIDEAHAEPATYTDTSTDYPPPHLLIEDFLSGDEEEPSEHLIEQAVDSQQFENPEPPADYTADLSVADGHFHAEQPAEGEFITAGEELASTTDSYDASQEIAQVHISELLHAAAANPDLQSSMMSAAGRANSTFDDSQSVSQIHISQLFSAALPNNNADIAMPVYQPLANTPELAAEADYEQIANWHATEHPEPHSEPESIPVETPESVPPEQFVEPGSAEPEQVEPGPAEPEQVEPGPVEPEQIEAEPVETGQVGSEEVEPDASSNLIQDLTSQTIQSSDSVAEEPPAPAAYPASFGSFLDFVDRLTADPSYGTEVDNGVSGVAPVDAPAVAPLSSAENEQPPGDEAEQNNAEAAEHDTSEEGTPSVEQDAESQPREQQELSDHAPEISEHDADESVSTTAPDSVQDQPAQHEDSPAAADEFTDELFPEPLFEASPAVSLEPVQVDVPASDFLDELFEEGDTTSGAEPPIAPGSEIAPSIELVDSQNEVIVADSAVEEGSNTVGEEQQAEPPAAEPDFIDFAGSAADLQPSPFSDEVPLSAFVDEAMDAAAETDARHDTSAASTPQPPEALSDESESTAVEPAGIFGLFDAFDRFKPLEEEEEPSSEASAILAEDEAVDEEITQVSEPSGPQSDFAPPAEFEVSPIVSEEATPSLAVPQESPELVLSVEDHTETAAPAENQAETSLPVVAASEAIEPIPPVEVEARQEEFSQSAPLELAALTYAEPASEPAAEQIAPAIPDSPRVIPAATAEFRLPTAADIIAAGSAGAHQSEAEAPQTFFTPDKMATAFEAPISFAPPESDLQFAPTIVEIDEAEFEQKQLSDFTDWTNYRLWFGGSEKVLPETGTIAKVGRNRQTCDVAIQEPAVSREHCQIELLTDGPFLRDLGSRHGTFIVRGGKEISCAGQPVRLENGDFIRLGKPGAPALEWLCVRSKNDALKTETITDELSDEMKKKQTRIPKAALEEGTTPLVDSDSEEEEVVSVEQNNDLAAAAAAIALSSGLGQESIDAIMSAMMNVPESAGAAVKETQPVAKKNDLEAAAALAAAGGLGADAIDAIFAAMKAGGDQEQPPAIPHTATTVPVSAATVPPALPTKSAPAAAVPTSSEPAPSPPPPTNENNAPEVPSLAGAESPHSPLTLPIEPPPAEPAAGPPAKSEQQPPVFKPTFNAPPPVHSSLYTPEPGEVIGNGHDSGFLVEPSSNVQGLLAAPPPVNQVSRIKATADNPYADVDAVMDAIDSQLSGVRRQRDDDDERNRKKLRPT